MLAVLLKKRGHQVRVVTYYPSEFFKPLLDEAGVPVERVVFRSQLHRIWAMRRAIRAGSPEGVVAYLNIPSVLAELASLPRRNYALVVSERSTDYAASDGPAMRWRYWLHRLADAVVPNSYAQQAVLRDVAPKLAPRVATILNCVDLERFRPAAVEDLAPSSELRILCVGRFSAEKNHLRLLEAAEIVNRQRPELKLRVDAYGNKSLNDGKPGPLSGQFLELQEALRESPVQARFRLHGPVEDVTPLYQASSALCLASVYEGCSNVIGEAMACGKPVLASQVGDNPVLVEDGVNGFLFDPLSPDDIANAILRFSGLSPEERAAMGKAGRRRAEEMLSPERFVGQYEQLILSISSRSGKPDERGVRWACKDRAGRTPAHWWSGTAQREPARGNTGPQ